LKTAGGSVRIADSTNFQTSRMVAAAGVETESGAMRGPPGTRTGTSGSISLLTRQGRMTVFGGTASRALFDVRADDVDSAPFAFGITGIWKCSSRGKAKRKVSLSN
jgi:oxalate decarboxylase